MTEHLVMVGGGNREIRIESSVFYEQIVGSYVLNVYNRSSVDDESITLFDTETGDVLIIDPTRDSQRWAEIIEYTELCDLLHPEFERVERDEPARYVEIPCLEHCAFNPSETDEHMILREYLLEISDKIPKDKFSELYNTAGAHIGEVLDELEKLGISRFDFEDYKRLKVIEFSLRWLNDLGRERGIKYIIELYEDDFNELLRRGFIKVDRTGKDVIIGRLAMIRFDK